MSPPPNSAATAVTGWASTSANSTATASPRMLLGWCARYPIVSIEDPFAEDDPNGFRRFTAAVGDRIQVIGDDFWSQTRGASSEAARERSANAVLIKVNQAGTVSEAEAGLPGGHALRDSERSSPPVPGKRRTRRIVHLAIGWGAGQLKVGSFSRSERMAKWNEVLRIEEALGAKALFAGVEAMRPGRRPEPPDAPYSNGGG